MNWKTENEIIVPDRRVCDFGLGLNLGLGAQQAAAAAASSGSSYLIDLGLTSSTGTSQLTFSGSSYTFSASGATCASGNCTILSDATVDDSTITDFTASVEFVSGGVGTGASLQVWAMVDSDSPDYGSPHDGYRAEYHKDGYIRVYERTVGFDSGAASTPYDTGRQPQAGDVLGIRMIYKSGSGKWEPQAYLNGSPVVTDFGDRTKPAGCGQGIAVTHWQGSTASTVKNLRAADNS